ncbi:ABC transporter permease [Amnibacterium endophyticum]|uniref:ABC transporter permease n=1 Tax=Amnibacterium endophyticum TaxID=2109337 RepID=A0ABW4LEH2_9MICO
MSAVDLVGTVADLELRQRVRSTAWYVLLGVAAVVLAGTTALLLATAGAFGAEAGAQVVPVLVFLVLLLGTLVTPALAGGAINGDRDAGTLATTQVTLVSAAQLLLGKFLAAWAAALAFLVVAVPFLLVAVIAGGVRLSAAAVALGVTAVELGVVAAIGVGLSAVIARPIFSVVTTYLVVAALSIGTVIVFGLAGLAFPRTITSIDRYPTDESQEAADGTVVCGDFQTTVSTAPSYDRVWGVLAVNPYVVLADAVPAQFTSDGSPADLFTGMQAGIRSLQIAPETVQRYDACSESTYVPGPSEQQVLARTVPSWFVGLAVHVLLGALSLLAGLRALRTPARRLARGSRIA